MSINWYKSLLELSKAIGKCTLIAGAAAQDLISHALGHRYHICLDVVNPGINLGLLSSVSAAGELSIVSREVASNR